VLASCSADRNQPKRDTPLAVRIIELEEKYLDVDGKYKILVEEIVSEGVEKLTSETDRPNSRDEAIQVFELLAEIFSNRNFVQPTGSPENFPDIISEALEPVDIPTIELEKIIFSELNQLRLPYYNHKKPFYFVDCDIASLLIITIFNELGWKSSLVQSRQHMFTRLYISDTEYVNWDWTISQSVPDEFYLIDSGPENELYKINKTYLSDLTTDEILGNFLGLIGTSVDDYTIAKEIYEKSYKLDTDNPRNLSYLSWIYATIPEYSTKYSNSAIMLAHKAVSADLTQSVRLQSLACAYAAAGEWGLAEVYHEKLISESSKITPRIRVNSLNIQNRKICE